MDSTSERLNVSRPTVVLTRGSSVALPVRDKYDDGRLTVDCDRYSVRMYCRYTRAMQPLGLIVIPEGSAGRQEDGGPEVPGPWGTTFALASVISSSPGRGPELIIFVEEGARFYLAGQVYKIIDDRPMNYPRLVAVKLPNGNDAEANVDRPAIKPGG